MTPALSLILLPRAGGAEEPPLLRRLQGGYERLLRRLDRQFTLLMTLTFLLLADEKPEPVAMVLSVQGDGKIRRMDLLRPGDSVSIPAKGSVRLVFLT